MAPRSIGGMFPSPDSLLRRLGGSSGGLPAYDPMSDPDVRQDIQDIQAELELQIQEHQVRQSLANHAAERQRVPIRHDMDVQNLWRQLGTAKTQELYDALQSQVAAITPQIGADYAAGAAGIGQAYDQGLQGAHATNMIGSDALAAMGANINPGAAAAIGQTASNPIVGMAQDIQAAATSAIQNLQILGNGEVTAAQQLPVGYANEGQREIGYFQDEVGGNLGELAQQLANIQADVVPFNLGLARLRAEQGIRDTIRAAQERRASESARRYQNEEGVYNYLQDTGGDSDMGQYLLNAIAESGNDPAAVQAAISNYFPGDFDLPQLSRDQLERLTGSGDTNLEDILGQLDFGDMNGNNYVQYDPDGPGGDPAQRVFVENLGNVQNFARDQEEQRRLLQRLYNIFQGNYSSYTG